MPHPKVMPVKQPLLAAATLSLILLASSGAERFPVLAHQVEIEGDVGATLHIEPNDTPRAGEEVLAWFALTRKGGKSIPLAACDCTLAIYQQQTRPANQQTADQSSAILEPSLKAVEAESYQGIPGATFTFPTVGAYTLIISGSPKQENDFNAFSFNFDVTVASGVPVVPESEDNRLPAPTANNTDTVSPEAASESAGLASYLPGLAIGAGGVVLLGLGAVFLKRSR